MGEFARGKSKHRPRDAKELFGGRYPFIQTGDIKEANLYVDKFSRTYSELGLAQSKLWEKDTLCITIAANIAETAILKFDACFPDSVVGFRAHKDKSDVYFMHYLFCFIKNRIQKATSGSVQDNINLAFLKKLRLQIPTIENQKKISNILLSLDKKIELNNEMNKTLEEMAQALFKRWFIDFEFPNEEGKPYKSSGGEMVESELGVIPKGWSVCNLQDVAIINPRESIKKGEEKTFVEMANLPLNSARVMQTAIKEFKGGTKFRNGDILMARITPCLENRKTAIVDFLEDDELAFGSTEYIIIRPEYLNSYYLYCLARYDEFRNYAIKNMNGSSGRQRVDAKYIKEYKIVKPTEYILKKYNEVCKGIFIKMKENDIESKSMTDIRDSLLPKLMSGEIRVDNMKANL